MPSEPGRTASSLLRGSCDKVALSAQRLQIDPCNVQLHVLLSSDLGYTPCAVPQQRLASPAEVDEVDL